MKRKLSLIIKGFWGFYLLVWIPNVYAQAELPQAAVSPVTSIGSISDAQKQIVFNRLLELLSTQYNLVSQSQFQKAQEAVFEQLEFEECTEEICIRKIQEILQVENLFTLQMIREGQDTQLSLTLIDLEKKTVKNEYCEACDTRQLNQRVESLVKGFSKLPVIPGMPQETVEVKKKTLEHLAQLIEAHTGKTTQAGSDLRAFIRQYGLPVLKQELQLSPQGQFNLGKIYRKGYGLAADEKEALAWYQKSADQGYAPSQSILGFMYRHGLGVEKNDQRAVYWYRKASNQGYARAQFNLGSMYRKGFGVTKSEEEALALYRQAAQNNDQTAQKVLKWMESQ
ncbi:tetratricopeptide repeat protein [Deltaproteobacteria bacterium TL4]